MRPRAVIPVLLWLLAAVPCLSQTTSQSQELAAVANQNHSGLPIVLVHGWCGDPEPWSTLIDPLLNGLNQVSGSYNGGAGLYSDHFLYYITSKNIDSLADKYPAVKFQDATGTGTHHGSPDETSRFFAVAFRDGTGSVPWVGLNPIQAADISIRQKASELANFIWKIKQATHAPRVVVVAHSLGGLVARAYMEGMAEGTDGNSIGYNNDIALLVTLDTPHKGSPLAGIDLSSVASGNCFGANTKTKREMDPNSSEELLNSLNSSTGTQALLNEATFIQAVVSHGDTGNIGDRYIYRDQNGADILINSLIGDDVVSKDSQNIVTVLGLSPAWGSLDNTLLANETRNVHACFALHSVDFLPSLEAKFLMHFLGCLLSQSNTSDVISSSVRHYAVVRQSIPLQSDGAEVKPLATLKFGIDPIASTYSMSDVVWSVLEGPEGGSIDANGIYTPPSSCINHCALARPYHVVAIDKNNIKNLGIAAVDIDLSSDILDTPTILSPANSATGVVGSPTLAWSNIASVSYRVMLANNPADLPSDRLTTACDNCLINQTATTNSLTVPGGVLLGATTYYWQVKAFVPGQSSDSSWSNHSVFTTAGSSAGGTQNLPSPALNSPSNGDLGVPVSATFNWSSVPGATSYRVMIGTSPDSLTKNSNDGTCGTGCLVNQTVATNSLTLNPSQLQNGTAYYWQVHGRNATQFGDWSTTSQFVTASAGTSLAIITNGLPNATVGNLYLVQLSAIGGTAPYHWRATSLPSGMNISDGGAFYGTATQPGSSPVTIQLNDSAGGVSQVTITFTVNAATQSACSYSLARSGQAYSSESWVDSFQLTTGPSCSWMASTNDSWISLLNLSGTGSQYIGYWLASNPLTTARSGQLTVSGRNSTLNYSIYQNGAVAGTPQISIPATEIDLGNVLVGTRYDQTILFNSVGTQPLSFVAAAVNGGSDFSAGYTPSNILPNHSGSFIVSFTPQSLGSQAASVQVISNDPVSPILNIRVVATGIAPNQTGVDFLWSSLANAPESLSTPKIAVLGNKIYVFDNHSFSYDPTVQQWTPLAPQPHVSAYGGAAVIGGKIYVYGDQSSNVIDIYDSGVDSWTSSTPIPTPVHYPAVAVASGQLYVVGGSLGNAATQTKLVQAYDPVQNTWTQKTAIPIAREGAIAATVNNLIYVIGGGYEDIGTQSKETDVYDPQTDTWHQVDPIPTYRTFAAAAVNGSKIYLFGGVANGVGAAECSNVAESLDTSVMDTNPVLPQMWTEFNRSGPGRYAHGAAFINNEAYLIGGQCSPNTATTSITVEKGVFGAAPIVNVPVRNASFGNVPIGQTGEVRFLIQNLGNSTLNLNYSAPNTPDSISTFRGPGNPTTGGSGYLILRFVPLSPGPVSETYHFTTNDPINPQFDITVTGTGVQAASGTDNWQVVDTKAIPGIGMLGPLAVKDSKAYIARRGTPGLSTIDLNTNQEIAYVPFSNHPDAIAHSVALHDIHVLVSLGNDLGGPVAIIDRDTSNAPTYVPVGFEPLNTLEDDSGIYSFVSNSNESKIAVLNPFDHLTQRIIALENVAVSMTLDATRRRAYLTTGFTPGPHELREIDLVSGQLLRSFSTFYAPVSVLLNDNLAYVDTEASLDVFDLNAGTLISSVPVPSGSFGLVQLGTNLFLGNNSLNAVIVYDTLSNSISKIVPLGGGPSGIAADESTGNVYLTIPATQTLAVIHNVTPHLAISCDPLTVGNDASGQTTCSVASRDGFAGDVGLSCGGLPGSSNCSFDTPIVGVTGPSAGTARLNVRMDPQLSSATYSVTISGTASNTSSSIGVGAAIAARPTLSQNSIDFLSTVVSRANTRTITLKNDGNARMDVVDIATSGEYSANGSCGSPLLAGQSCQIAIDFRPLSTGARNGALTISTTAPNTPIVLPLTGSGFDVVLNLPRPRRPSRAGTQTVHAGQTATFEVGMAVQGRAIGGKVSVTCEGAPKNSVCLVSPSAVSLSRQSATIDVRLRTTAHSSRARRIRSMRQSPAGTPPGNYELHITVNGAGLSRALGIPITIQ